MSRRIGYQGAFLTIWQEEVELPSGRSIELDVVRHPGAAAIVPFANETDVVLIRQFRHAAGGTLLEVPAGKLEGEAPEICAARELEEEVGRRAGRLEPLGSILTTPGFTDEVIHLFAAFDLEPVPTRHDHDEVIEVVQMPLRDAVDLIWRGELRDAKSALAILHASHRYGVRG
jgi:ADP-ribose pyrophosphatase